MNVPLSVLFIGLICILTIYRKHRWLFFFVILSAVCSDFTLGIISFSRVTVAQFIVFMQFPFLLRFFKFEILVKRSFSIFRVFFFEFLIIILVGIYYAFLSPFELDMIPSYDRPFGRDLISKYFTGSIRIFTDLLVLGYVVFLLKSKKINIAIVLRTLFIVSLIQMIWTIVDFNSGYLIDRLVSINHKPIYFDRPSGWCYEPKSLSRLTFGSMITLLGFYLFPYKVNKIPVVYVLVPIFTFLYAQSLSGYIAGFISFLIGIIFLLKLKNIHYFIFGLILSSIVILIYFKSEASSGIKYRIDRIKELSVTKNHVNEPAVFTILDLPDRRVANLLFHEPKYFLTGCGPNLVTIPATKYISSYLMSFSLFLSDVMPTTFLYYLSRSGLFGFVLICSVFFRLYIRLNRNRMKSLLFILITTFVFTAMNNQIWFFLNLSFVYGFYYYELNDSNEINFCQC